MRFLDKKSSKRLSSSSTSPLILEGFLTNYVNQLGYTEMGRTVMVKFWFFNHFRNRFLRLCIFTIEKVKEFGLRNFEIFEILRWFSKSWISNLKWSLKDKRCEIPSQVFREPCREGMNYSQPFPVFFLNLSFWGARGLLNSSGSSSGEKRVEILKIKFHQKLNCMVTRYRKMAAEDQKAFSPKRESLSLIVL